MGFRYRKSIRLGKFFRVNLSKSGVGYSVGLPGTGLSWGASPRRRKGGDGGVSGFLGLLILGFLAFVFVAAYWPRPGRRPESTPPPPSVMVPMTPHVVLPEGEDIAEPPISLPKDVSIPPESGPGVK